MTNVRQHSRRTEGARRLFHPRSSTGFRTYWGSASRLRADPGEIDRSSLDERTEHLVTQLIEAAKLGSVREDATFGDYAPLFGFLRSCVMQEGRLLELAIAEAVENCPSLSLLPPRAMPIVPAAVEMLKRTPGHAIKGIRFPSRVHASEVYKPDLFVVDQVRHTALMLDIKRSLASYRPREIEQLRFRMLAVASIASEWIAERQGPVLVEVETAIIDGADEVSDHEHGVFRLSEIDELLGTEGTVKSIARARTMFADLVQQELRERCRDLALGEGGHDPEGADSIGRQADAANPTDVGPEPSVMMSPARFGYARRPSLH